MLIVGGGRVGEETAKLLTEGKKHKVTLIDCDLGRCEALSEGLGHEIFCGDGTLPHTLEEVGVQDTQFFLALADDDKTNVLCAMLAQSYNVPSIYARIKDPKWIEACERLGIDVIDPAQIMAYNIDARIRGDTFLEFLEEVTRDADFKMIRISPDTKKEQNIVGFEKKRHIHVIGILRKGTFIVPTTEEKIKPNDTVAYMTRRKNLHLF
ncbi:TrkA family potassium uptake protein [Candidatus Borrarchaeum sp.]|uniref:potassium channel family protein n=1 Tax=Candidatus Borrarchaeum sp. TaxID=2846742 RepID=UPI00257CDB75|nr:NAD-binding protein [Candidatus Borrarchaeum sp.]